MFHPRKVLRFVVTAGLMALFGAGCASMSKAEHANLRDNLEALVETSQDLNVDIEVDLFLAPNGSLSFGPGMTYTNNSYLRAQVRARATE